MNTKAQKQAGSRGKPVTAASLAVAAEAQAKPAAAETKPAEATAPTFAVPANVKLLPSKGSLAPKVSAVTVNAALTDRRVFRVLIGQNPCRGKRSHRFSNLENAGNPPTVAGYIKACQENPAPGQERRSAQRLHSDIVRYLEHGYIEIVANSPEEYAAQLAATAGDTAEKQ